MLWSMGSGRVRHDLMTKRREFLRETNCCPVMANPTSSPSYRALDRNGTNRAGHFLSFSFRFSHVPPHLATCSDSPPAHPTPALAELSHPAPFPASSTQGVISPLPPPLPQAWTRRERARASE